MLVLFFHCERGRTKTYRKTSHVAFFLTPLCERICHRSCPGIGWPNLRSMFKSILACVPAVSNKRPTPTACSGENRSFQLEEFRTDYYFYYATPTCQGERHAAAPPNAMARTMATLELEAMTGRADKASGGTLISFMQNQLQVFFQWRLRPALCTEKEKREKGRT